MIAIDTSMPSRCDKCPFADVWYNNGQVRITCHITDRKQWMEFNQKAVWCPLIEINAIDRDTALSFPYANGQYDKANANEDFILGCETYKEWLEQLPIIGEENNK